MGRDRKVQIRQMSQKGDTMNTRTIVVPEGSDLQPTDDEPIPDAEPVARFFVGYRGERQPDGTGIIYRVESDSPIIYHPDGDHPIDGDEHLIEIPIAPSQAAKHYADSFDWGHSRAGAAQTALAILIDFGCTDEAALKVHRDLIRHVIRHLAPTEFDLWSQPLGEWIILSLEELHNKQTGDNPARS